MTALSVDICLCTFRRPHLKATLHSLSALIVKPEWSVRIIIADNDDTASAQELVAHIAQNINLNVIYIHAPARNISIARNACLEAATADFVVFIDDDECAPPEWLQVLVSTITSSQADIVVGPVRALYPDSAPTWIKKGDFHATQPVWVKNTIITGYTCNVICRRNSIGTLRFRTELGRSGGEDTAFFTALHQQGHRIAYAPQAWLNETITPDRLSFSWLFRRRFRSGQTHALLLQEDNPARTRHLCKALLKWNFCTCMAFLTLFSPLRSCTWLLRGAVHLGAVSHLLGKQELIQYG